MLRSTALSLLFLAAALSVSAAAPVSWRRHHLDFIRGSCQTTRYPRICEQSLTSYAPLVRRSPRQLARAALKVSIERAKSVSLFAKQISAEAKNVGRTREAGGAFRDCMETLADGADRLQRSLDEMRRMGRARSPRFRWHLSNVQTWVSAALTDQSTCFDGLSPKSGGGGGAAVRAAIRKRVAEVSQVTSNALALANQLVHLRHKD